MERERPVVVSTRVAPAERGRIRAVAEADGVTVSELLHQLVMPQVNDRLSRDLANASGSDGQRSS